MIVIALGANLPSRAGSPRDTLKAALTELAAQGVQRFGYFVLLRNQSMARSC